MKKYLQTTKEKVLATISLVWLVIIYASTMTGYSKDTEGFFIIGLGPIVLGWGIYIIWYDNINKISQKKSRKASSKTEPKKMSKWAEIGSVIGGIIFYKLFGAMSLVGIGVGYVVHKIAINNFSKPVSIIAGIIAGVIAYLVVAGIYFSNIA